MQRQAWLGRDGGFPASGASQPVGPPVVPERVFPQVERSPSPDPSLRHCCVDAAWLGDLSGGDPTIG